MSRAFSLGLALTVIGLSYARAEDDKKPMLAHPIPSLHEGKVGQEKPLKLTLEEAIARAVRESSSIIRAQGETEISGDQLLQGYAQFLPNVVAQGAYNNVRGSTHLTTTTPTDVQTRNHGASYQVSATLNLFNGFADLANWRASVARKEAANMSLRRAKQQIALDVAQSFLQVVLDQEITRIAEKNLASSQARESLLSEQTRVGVRNTADLFRQQAQTSSDESFLVNAQAKERSDELALLRKIRLDTTRNFEVVRPTLAEEAKGHEFDNEDELVKTALGNRADLSASEQVARAARWDVTFARANYLPKLDFGASVASAGRFLDRQLVNGGDVVPADQPSVNDQLTHDVNTTVGVTLTWSLWDRWMTSVNVQRAKVNARNLGVDNDDRRLQVIAETRQAFGDYKAVLQQLESTKKGLLAAQKAYEVVQGRYQVGSSSFVDLTISQAALVQAEANRAQALIAFALQTRSLQTALGTSATE